MKKDFPVSVCVITMLTAFLLVSCADKQDVLADTSLTAAIQETETLPEISEETQNAESETTREAASLTETQEEAETVTEPEPVRIPEKSEIVRVKDYIPDIFVDLRYATADNFTGTVIYDFTDAWLRYGTIEKLAAVQDQVREDGYSLKIWDAFRPVSAQFTLWDVYPDSTYVANPNRGYSSHSRGNTVDITLVREDGTLIPMPSDLDDFSLKADRDYSDCSEEEAVNARYLENAMKEHGFEPYSAEWWHFSDTDSYQAATDIELPAAETAD